MKTGGQVNFKKSRSRKGTTQNGRHVNKQVTPVGTLM